MAVQYVRKLISLFYKDYSDKPTAIFEINNTAPLMARLNIRPNAITKSMKQKQECSANKPNKQIEKG